MSTNKNHKMLVTKIPFTNIVIKFAIFKKMSASERVRGGDITLSVSLELANNR